MRMNFGEVIEIEDLGKHSAATVVNLGILLAGTVDATPDHKRKHFYEIEQGATVYYVYFSPFSGKVFLLASWKNYLPPLTQLTAGAADVSVCVSLNSR
jgi:hypothetical protein